MAWSGEQRVPRWKSRQEEQHTSRRAPKNRQRTREPQCERLMVVLVVPPTDWTDFNGALQVAGQAAQQTCTENNKMPRPLLVRDSRSSAAAASSSSSAEKIVLRYIAAAWRGRVEWNGSRGLRDWPLHHTNRGPLLSLPLHTQSAEKNLHGKLFLRNSPLPPLYHQ